ncbi:MAG: Gfo/Idh/MocA family oxidoreductase [Rhodospirillales bacterium]|nr:Gfo/Idh/MocA family oxidoreductase [Rhodospirillales bacterium]
MTARGPAGLSPSPPCGSVSPAPTMRNRTVRKRRNKLGVGVVGLGVGEQHARAYARHAGCELRWLYDLSAKQAKAVRRRLGVGAIAKSYRQILDDDTVNAVSIASFDDMHFHEVKAAFAAGKHVFVEKPLCRTTGELATLVTAWKKAGKPHLQSNLVLRAAPVYGWLKKEIESGRLGAIYAFDGDYLYGRLNKITGKRAWRGKIRDYSIMAGGGIHLIDLMLWLTGERPHCVVTVGNRMCTKKEKLGFDDFKASTFEFSSGLIGRITGNLGCVHRHHHVVRVFGTEATFVYDDKGPRLHRSRDEGRHAEALKLKALPAGKGVLIPDFVGGILAGRDPALAARREFDLIAAVAAADEALKKKRPVAIGYVK